MSKNKIKAKTLSLFKYKRGLIITLKIAAGLVGFLVLLVIVGAFIPYALSSKECQTFTTIDTRHQASTPDTSITGYSRPEESTYLTFPEWYIVYSAEEYAHFIKFNPPSRFPYFSSIGQYWCGYKQVSRAVKKSGLPSNFGDQLMLGVIGTSYSLEYEFKALYENTIGNVTEVLSFNQKTDEDVYAQKVAQEYADFLYEIPWYQFPFGSKLKGLWTHTRFFGPYFIRKSERKIVLSLEYSVKAVYAWIINKGTQSVYGPEDLTIYARIHALPDDVLNAEPTIKLVKHNDDQSETILIPRYKQFTDSVIGMAHHNIQFQDIAGNHTIAVSLLAPRDWHYDLSSTTPIFSTHILTDKKQDRYVIAIPVTSLTDVVHQLETQKIQIEHIYDY